MYRSHTSAKRSPLIMSIGSDFGLYFVEWLTQPTAHDNSIIQHDVEGRSYIWYTHFFHPSNGQACLVYKVTSTTSKQWCYWIFGLTLIVHVYQKKQTKKTICFIFVSPLSPPPPSPRNFIMWLSIKSIGLFDKIVSTSWVIDFHWLYRLINRLISILLIIIDFYQSSKWPDYRCMQIRCTWDNKHCIDLNTSLGWFKTKGICHCGLNCNNCYYHIDKSALLGNMPLINFVQSYIRDTSDIFSISSLVRISMTSLPIFSRSDQ